MGGRADDHRLQIGFCQQVFHVVKGQGDLEPFGDSLRLSQVAVTDRRDTRLLHSAKIREMNELRDRAAAHDTDSYDILISHSRHSR